MIKTNKLAPKFEPVPHKVVEKKGAELIIENEESNAKYRRNVSHVVKAPPTDPSINYASTNNPTEPAAIELRPKRICRRPPDSSSDETSLH